MAQAPTDLEGLLAFVRDLDLDADSDIAKLSSKLTELLEASQERHEGKKTKRAKDALQTLANPRLQTTHKNTKYRAVRVARDNQLQAFFDAMTPAIVEGLKLQQIDFELERFDGSGEPLEGMEPTREDHGGRYESRFVEPLFKSLREYDVSPSAFARAPRYLHDLTAKMYADVHADPELKDPSNILNAMARAGIFEAFRKPENDAEMVALDLVGNSEGGEDILDLHKTFRETFPDQRPVSAAFLRGCKRIAEATDTISIGAFEALRATEGELYENDAKVVCAILGWEAEKLPDARGIARYLREQRLESIEKYSSASFLIFQVQLMLDNLKPEAGSSSEWFPQFAEWMIEFARQVEPIVPSETTFFAIMYAAFERSFAKVKLRELAHRDALSKSARAAEQTRIDAVRAGKPFKLDEAGCAVCEDHDRYHFIPQQPINPQEYLLPVVWSQEGRHRQLVNANDQAALAEARKSSSRAPFTQSPDNPIKNLSVERFAPPAFGEAAMVFSPERIRNWPTDPAELRAIQAMVPRSTGLSRSTSLEVPFGGWMLVGLNRPFCHMAMRRQPDLSEREGVEGPVDPFDLARMEVPPNDYNIHLMGRVSPVLGTSHPLMLPPHSSLAWYGGELGWPDVEAQALGRFGSPTRPDSVSPMGDRAKLMEAFRGVALLRTRQLASEERGHFLAQGGDLIAEAAEDLARWWLFVLLWRHDPQGFELLYPGSFLHGVHGPDFAVKADGSVVWSDHERPSHVGIWSVATRDALANGKLDEAALPDDPTEALEGPRRKKP